MTTGFSARDYFEEQYVLRKSLPSFMDHVAEWEALSEDDQFIGHSHSVERYGDHPRQTFELFKVEQGKRAKGLAVFIHGGFWRAMDRQQSRFVAKPFLDNGYDCVIAEYRLMPEFVLGDLVDDTAAMLHKLADLKEQYCLSDTLIVSGHSAGAHLAAFGLKQATRTGFKTGNCSLLLFSGVFDIYPVSITSLGDKLQMSDEDIARWSVYEGDADNGIEPLFLVGADETDDFKRQSIIGAQRMGRPDSSNIYFVPNANHLTLMTRFARDEALASEMLGKLNRL